MAQHWRKQASVAYGYSLTRLALNTYMYFEELPLTYDDRAREQKETDEGYDGAFRGFSEGRVTSAGKDPQLP